MKDLVKVQCILDTGYIDAETGKFIDKNKIYSVTEERAKVLESKKAVKRIEGKLEETKELEVENKEKTKRRNRRSI